MMKSVRYGVVLLVASSASANARPYSLQELMDLARRNNPSLAAAAQQN
jgi:hypothetical protein